MQAKLKNTLAIWNSGLWSILLPRLVKAWMNQYSLCIHCTVQSCLSADSMAAHMSVKNSQSCLGKMYICRKQYLKTNKLCISLSFLCRFNFPFSSPSQIFLQHSLHTSNSFYVSNSLLPYNTEYWAFITRFRQENVFTYNTNCLKVTKSPSKWCTGLLWQEQQQKGSLLADSF